jgi:hypothetical protein
MNKGFHMRIAAIVFGVLVIGFGVIPRCNHGPDVLSLEAHSRLTESGLKENPPEVRDAWVREGKLIIDDIQPPKKEEIVDIKEAFSVYKKSGIKGVIALGKKSVRFPKMNDTLLSVKKAIPVMNRYKENGVNLANETMVNTGLTGTNHLPVFLPRHFWSMIQDAARSAGLKDIKIAWGVRDHNLQAVMFVRSTFTKCGKYPSTASKSCIKKVRKSIAGKPKKLGYTHFFSADIDNWHAMKEELLLKGFAVGCSGVDGEKDARHTTWGITQKEASLKCSISELWRHMNIF